MNAAKEWHEAKLLAEGGFTGTQDQPLEKRYERTEADLFARIEAMGRDIERRVTGNDSPKFKIEGEQAKAAQRPSTDPKPVTRPSPRPLPERPTTSG